VTVGGNTLPVVIVTSKGWKEAEIKIGISKEWNVQRSVVKCVLIQTQL